MNLERRLLRNYDNKGNLISMECGKCHEIKEISEFPKNKWKKDGVETTCNKCRKKQRVEYYKQNADKKREYQTEYRKQNIDKIKEYQAEYYKQNTATNEHGNDKVNGIEDRKETKKEIRQREKIERENYYK